MQCPKCKGEMLVQTSSVDGSSRAVCKVCGAKFLLKRKETNATNNAGTTANNSAKNIAKNNQSSVVSQNVNNQQQNGGGYSFSF